MKQKLALVAATAIVTTGFNYKFSVWKYKKAEDSFKESANHIGTLMYSLGQIHGTLTAQSKMRHARPVVEETKYVSHTMN